MQRGERKRKGRKEGRDAPRPYQVVHVLGPDEVRVLQEHEHGRHGAVDAHQAVEVVHGEPAGGRRRRGAC